MALAAVVAIGAIGALLFDAFTGKGGSSSRSSGGPKTPTPGKPKGSPGVDFPAPGGDKKQPPKPAAHDPRIDANMPAPMAAVTIAMLDNPQSTPAALLVAAQAAELAGFPIAAAALRQAAEDRSITPEEGPPGAPVAGSPAALAADFASMDDPPRSEVMSALTTSTDPDFLEAQGDEAESSGFLEVAAAFQQKAAMIRQSHGTLAPHLPGLTPDKPGGGGGANPDFPGGGNVPGASAQQIAAAFSMGAKATADMAAANAAGSGQLAFVAAQEAAQAVAMQTAVNQALIAAGESPIAFPPIGIPS